MINNQQYYTHKLYV